MISTDDVVIESIWKIANSIVVKRGYQVSIRIEHVRIVMEAAVMLRQEWEANNVPGRRGKRPHNEGSDGSEGS